MRSRCWLLRLCSVVASRQSGSEAAAKPDWSPPRLPDGQYDLEGVWDFSTITPLERPSGLANKQTLTDEEAAVFEREENQRQNRDLIDPEEGRRQYLPGSVIPYNEFWYERGSKIIGDKRTSLIVDPPDGRIPPLTPEAQKRLDAQAAIARDEQLGIVRADSYLRSRSLADRCILGFNAGPPMTPGAYNNHVQISQAAWIRDAGRRDGARCPRHPGRRTSASAGSHSAVQGRLARPLGGPDAGDRHDELPARDELSRIEREPASRRALDARRRRHAALRVHRRRSEDLDEAVDRGDSHEEESTRRSTSTRATKGTTRCRTSSAARVCRSRRSRHDDAPIRVCRGDRRERCGVCRARIVPRRRSTSTSLTWKAATPRWLRLADRRVAADRHRKRRRRRRARRESNPGGDA